jgi:hypothetical protein
MGKMPIVKIKMTVDQAQIIYDILSISEVECIDDVLDDIQRQLDIIQEGQNGLFV